MLCSVLIPSRDRPERLRKAVDSVFATARDVEVLVRLDSDDSNTLSKLDMFADCRVLVGPRGEGYGSLHTMYEDLSDASSGAWSFVMNDDAWLEGDGWDEELAAIPTTGFIVQPGVIANVAFLEPGEPCKYPNAEGGPFPLAPRLCWRALGLPRLEQIPVDTQLDRLLRGQHGWQTRFLSRLTLFHARDPGPPAVYEHPGILIPRIAQPYGPFESLLDVGGGPGIVGLDRWPIVGGISPDCIHVLDAFMPETIPPRFTLGNGLDAERIYGSKSFDVVQCCEVVEHLERDRGFELISVLERVARKFVIYTTPNGYLEQDPELAPNEPWAKNPFQKHLSGFAAADFESLGYYVHLNGGTMGGQVVAWKPIKT